MNKPSEFITQAFASPDLFEQWLSQHYSSADGIWIKIAKKASGIPTITHDQALDIALCYGWIDGQRNGLDDNYFLQKFTPRRQRSLWSKRNIGKVTSLIEAGRMQPSGQAEIDRAKQDGRWDAAYDAQKDMIIPVDFLTALQRNKPALEYFNTLSKSNVFAIVFRLHTAKKPETRARRFDAIMAMLERGEFR